MSNVSYFEEYFYFNIYISSKNVYYFFFAFSFNFLRQISFKSIYSCYYIYLEKI